MRRPMRANRRHYLSVRPVAHGSDGDSGDGGWALECHASVGETYVPTAAPVLHRMRILWRALGTAGFALSLGGAIAACNGALPLDCGAGVSLDTCRRAYSVANAELAAEEHPTDVWIGRQCPLEECPPEFLADENILVVFRLSDGPVAVIVERPQWEAIRYKGELSYPALP